MISHTYRQLLEEYVRFQSISPDRAFVAACETTANWLMALFERAGFQTSLLTHDQTNPVVLASFEVSPSAPTVLIYGHYDVQPISEASAWVSDPFELSEREGKLFARGVADNKGQTLIHIATVLDLIESGQLSKNIKFLIEGNEETGSPHLGDILSSQAATLTCDQLIISDGSVTDNRPTIDVSLRGMICVTIAVQTAATALHSGVFGGAVPNAAHELSKLLSSLFDADEHVLIPGFYKGAKGLPRDRKVDEKRQRFIQSISGVKGFRLESRSDFDTQTGLRPMLQVTSLQSGYTGDGYSNFVPDRATAKLNVRLVPKQDSAAVREAIHSFIKANIPPDVDIEVTSTEPVPPIDLITDKRKLAPITNILEAVYKKPVAYRHVGGTLGILSELRRLTGTAPLLISLANEDCHMHGPNENFSLDLISKGLVFSKAFFSGRWLSFE